MNTCICGHGIDEHERDYGPCNHDDCMCVMYETDDVDDSDYPFIWSAVAEYVKAAANWRCLNCGHPHGPGTALLECDDHCTHGYSSPYRVLTVHHLDGDKRNCMWWNLAALCQVCHLHVQARWHPDQEPLLPDMPAWIVLRQRVRRLALSGRAPGPDVEAGAYQANGLDRIAFLDSCIKQFRGRIPHTPLLLLADIPEFDKELQAAAAANCQIVWFRVSSRLGGRNLELRPWLAA